jgi:hypothetical protein
MIRDTSATDVLVTPARRSRLRRYGIPAAILAVAAGLAWPALSRFSSASQSVSLDRLRLGTVARGKFVSDLSAQGRVVAAVSPTLYAPAMGRVTLKVQGGDSVRKDQVLALIDSPEVTNEHARERRSRSPPPSVSCSGRGKRTPPAPSRRLKSTAVPTNSLPPTCATCTRRRKPASPTKASRSI